jgi:hypothetical protein
VLLTYQSAAEHVFRVSPLRAGHLVLGAVRCGAGGAFARAAAAKGTLSSCLSNSKPMWFSLLVVFGRLGCPVASARVICRVRVTSWRLALTGLYGPALTMSEMNRSAICVHRTPVLFLRSVLRGAGVAAASDGQPARLLAVPRECSSETLTFALQHSFALDVRPLRASLLLAALMIGR